MMTIFLLCFVVMAVAVLAMAVGVLMGRAPIAGSCGGLAQLGLGCDSCEKPCARKRRDAYRRSISRQGD